MMWNAFGNMNSFGLYPTLLECMETVDWFFHTHNLTLECFMTVMI